MTVEELRCEVTGGSIDAEGRRLLDMSLVIQKNKRTTICHRIYKLVAQGHMSSTTQAYIFDNHLVGYSNPNGNEFQEACDLVMGCP